MSTRSRIGVVSSNGGGPMACDFTVVDHGTVFSFTPLTDAAHDFVDENLALEDWQFMGPAFCVDRRCAHDLCDGIAMEGLTIG